MLKLVTFVGFVISNLTSDKAIRYDLRKFVCNEKHYLQFVFRRSDAREKYDFDRIPSQVY